MIPWHVSKLDSIDDFIFQHLPFGIREFMDFARVMPLLLLKDVLRWHHLDEVRT